MSKASPKIRDILGYLSDQLARGWLAFLISKHLYRAFQSQQITCARYLFITTYLSCTESAILALSRLTIPNGDSINIEYLLNISEKNSQAFPHAHKEEILKAVLEHKQKLAAIGSLLANIKEQRDRTIAHLDKKYINNPAIITANPPIDMNEVEKVFQLILHIINRYKGYFESSELYLANFERNIEDDLGYLLHLIKEADERD